jgi:hypothetical protein
MLNSSASRSSFVTGAALSGERSTEDDFGIAIDGGSSPYAAYPNRMRTKEKK